MTIMVAVTSMVSMTVVGVVAAGSISPLVNDGKALSMWSFVIRPLSKLAWACRCVNRVRVTLALLFNHIAVPPNGETSGPKRCILSASDSSNSKYSLKSRSEYSRHRPWTSVFPSQPRYNRDSETSEARGTGARRSHLGLASGHSLGTLQLCEA
jgi:hypothetical protein